MADDRLPELAGRVRALEQQPLAEHPDVLEDVHQAIIAELDRVGGWQRPSGQTPPQRRR
jgi:hypothetical protein